MKQKLTPEIESPWLTPEEVSEYLSITYSTLMKWRQAGRAPRAVVLPNGTLRTKREWIEEFMEELERTTV